MYVTIRTNTVLSKDTKLWEHKKVLVYTKRWKKILIKQNQKAENISIYI